MKVDGLNLEAAAVPSPKGLKGGMYLLITIIGHNYLRLVLSLIQHELQYGHIIANQA